MANKQVFTCSLDERTVQKIREAARERTFRNKSHLVEEAILKFLEDKE
ncbi:MAG: ribbon-helix-helix protein, CopG family [Candidatus Woesearchaeota archaeon]